MNVHPAAEIYPMLSKDEMALLVEDIRENGQQKPVLVLNGEIIDGRNRWRACEILGIAPKTEDVTVDNPIAYTHSLNMRRRHLTVSQRSLIAQSELDYVKANPGEKGITYKRLCEDNDMSIRTARRAKKVLEKGTPELKECVVEGEMTIREAERIAEYTPEEQEKLIKTSRDMKQKRPGSVVKTEPVKQATDVEVRSSLKKQSLTSLGELVRCVNEMGLFQSLYTHLDAIRSELERV